MQYKMLPYKLQIVVVHILLVLVDALEFVATVTQDVIIGDKLCKITVYTCTELLGLFGAYSCHSILEIMCYTRNCLSHNANLNSYSGGNG